VPQGGQEKNKGKGLGGGDCQKKAVNENGVLWGGRDRRIKCARRYFDRKRTRNGKTLHREQGGVSGSQMKILLQGERGEWKARLSNYDIRPRISSAEERGGGEEEERYRSLK